MKLRCSGTPASHRACGRRSARMVRCRLFSRQALLVAFRNPNPRMLE